MNTSETTVSEEPKSENGENGENGTEAGTNEFPSNRIWWRLLYMTVLVLVYSLSRLVVCAIMIFQFFWALFKKEPNHRLDKLSQSLATYTYQIVSYLTFVSDDLPFPLDGEWPRGAPR